MLDRLIIRLEKLNAVLVARAENRRRRHSVWRAKHEITRLARLRLL